MQILFSSVPSDLKLKLSTSYKIDYQVIHQAFADK